MQAVCALCKKNGDIQNSHIIPEFFYRLIYDLKPRRYHIISTDPSKDESFAQKGLRERLLCRDCEQKIGRWEHYCKLAFVNGKGLRATQFDDRIILDGLDYKTFKLFQMSLLWRMGVSTLPFFDEVDLGPHEEIIRTAILNENALQTDQYACVIVAVQIGGKKITDWLTEPSLVRVDGHHVYRLVITGFLFMFFVGRHPPPAALCPLPLNHRDQVTILIREATDIPYLADYLKTLGSAINARKKSKSKLALHKPAKCP